MTEETDLRLRYGQQKGDILVKGLEESINEAISQILETSLEARIFNRGFGSRLRNLLFEPMTDHSARFVFLEVQQAIERLEPRVELINSQSKVDPIFDENLYKIRLVYRILENQDVGEFDTFLKANS